MFARKLKVLFSRNGIFVSYQVDQSKSSSFWPPEFPHAFQNNKNLRASQVTSRRPHPLPRLDTSHALIHSKKDFKGTYKGLPRKEVKRPLAMGFKNGHKRLQKQRLGKIRAASDLSPKRKPFALFCATWPRSGAGPGAPPGPGAPAGPFAIRIEFKAIRKNHDPSNSKQFYFLPHSKQFDPSNSKQFNFP